MSLPRCDQCDNWRPLDGGGGRGICHWRPPRIVAALVTTGDLSDIDDIEHLSLWPQTRAGQGCRAGFLPREDPVVAFVRRARAGTEPPL